MLVMHRVELRRRDQQVIRHASLSAESPGLLFLVGPGGAGKSSLLCALAGAQCVDRPRLTGMAELDGLSIATAQVRTAWVPQRAELSADHDVSEQLALRCDASPARIAAWLAKAGVAEPRDTSRQTGSALTASQRRVLAVLADLHRDAALYLVDEPTAGLDESHVLLVRERLAELSRSASVIVATHNRQDCLALGGRTALLAGGTIQECNETPLFFGAPITAAARTYVDTGNCGLARPTTPPHNGDGIWWGVTGMLCGMSRPGLVMPADIQCRRLAASGVGLLVCLEERVEYPLEPVRAQGLVHHHIPVPDMAPPSFAQGVDLCRLAEPAIQNNQGIALHCRGGLGRTGTGMAAILIWFGETADEAIAKVRAAKPHAIQSLAQMRFLHDFADRIRGWH
jgi:atypical dual specificity phosphatase